MSRTSDLATVLSEADGNWLRTSHLAAEADIETKVVSALLANLRTRGVIESRITDSREAEYRVTNPKAMAEYIERVTDGKRAPREAVPETAPVAHADDETPDDDAQPIRSRLNGSIADVPATPALGDALLDAPNGKQQPAPVRDASPAKRAALKWAIDDRGKLILCLGDNAFELLPPQWAPLARFLEPLAGVFA